LKKVWEAVLALPVAAGFGFDEPSDLEGIQARRVGSVGRVAHGLSDEDLYDRMLGAWQGRCVGCALGKPFEAFMGPLNGVDSKGRIKAYAMGMPEGAHKEWPLSFYASGKSTGVSGSGPLGWSAASTREKLGYMETDDDICYTVIGQQVLLEKGKNFTTRDVAGMWLRKLPYGFVCTAETQAYRNLVSRYNFHHGEKEAIDWTWVATHENPYREWIGAQIRADSWGYAAPGDMALAAEFAWRDARMSHVKNGIYGEMFVAAMIAAAFVMKDVGEIVKAGLGEIPASSRLHRDVMLAVEICRRHGNRFEAFEAVFEEIYLAFGEMSPVHTNNNAAIVVCALLLGGGDFEKTVTLAVMGGWDTDCNGATAGSIVGAMLGAGALPAKWVSVMNDTIRAGMTGYDPIAISECARRSVGIAAEAGSRVWRP
jgi:hypothetical protein